MAQAAHTLADPIMAIRAVISETVINAIVATSIDTIHLVGIKAL